MPEEKVPDPAGVGDDGIIVTKQYKEADEKVKGTTEVVPEIDVSGWNMPGESIGETTFSRAVSEMLGDKETEPDVEKPEIKTLSQTLLEPDTVTEVEVEVEIEGEAAAEPESSGPAQDDAPPSAAAEAGQEDGTPSGVLDRFRELLPAVAINDEGDVYSAVEQLKETADFYNRVEAIVEEDERMQEYVNLRLAHPDEPASAHALMAFGGVDEAPDKHDDPDAYADYVASQRIAEAAKKREQEQLDASAAVRQKAQQSATSAFEAFLARQKLDPDKASQFATEFQVLLHGDNRGVFRQDAFDIVWRGLHHDELVAEAAKKARTEGRNAAIAELKGGTRPTSPKGSGLPTPSASGSGTPGAEPSKRKQLRDIAGKFSRSAGATLEEWTGWN